MPLFRFQLRREPAVGALPVDPDDLGLDLSDIHHAYLEVCKAIPDEARDLLIQGEDPLRWCYAIYDQKGRHLMEVPFADVLSPSEWRRRPALRGPHSGFRRDAARDALALDSFRRMFSTVDVGCVLLTPDLQVREINAFGARHSHVDRDAIRDTSILDVFDLSGKPKRDFATFWALAQRGVVSELIDMPYLVLDAEGRTTDGWWQARTWPIFDDGDRLLGLVEWAEPAVSPSAGGRTTVRISPGSAK